MASIINLFDYVDRSDRPTLVLVGLHRSPHLIGREENIPEDVLENCRTALAQARATAMPVAFVRQILPVKSINEPRNYPTWLSGFEPRRADMVFDTVKPSCYSCEEFAEVMEHNAGNFILAGLFAETNCVSTAVDAYHRRHNVTILADALASRARGTTSAQTIHRAAVEIMSIYGHVITTGAWLNHAPRGTALV